PVKIEQLTPLVKPSRKFVLRLAVVDGAAGIGPQLPFGVVDRKHDAPSHAALAGKVAEAKPFGDFYGDIAAGQVWVTMIDALELKRQRLIFRLPLSPTRWRRYFFRR